MECRSWLSNWAVWGLRDLGLAGFALRRRLDWLGLGIDLGYSGCDTPAWGGGCLVSGIRLWHDVLSEKISDL